MEKIENVENYSGPVDSGSHTIISTEWAGLGESGTLDFIRTEYDRDVDCNSSNSGSEMLVHHLISQRMVGTSFDSDF